MPLTRSKPLKVLVVDDSPLAAAWLRELLEGEGFVVSCSTGALDALRSITRDPPDVALVDVAMPSVGGDQLTGLIERVRGGDQVRILLCSSLEPRLLHEIAARTGAHGYVQKTGNAVAFLAAFRAALEPREAAR